MRQAKGKRVVVVVVLVETGKQRERERERGEERGAVPLSDTMSTWLSWQLTLLRGSAPPMELKANTPDAMCTL